MMIRKAKEQDIPRIAEIIVFGKRTAYRSIFQDDIESFNHLQVVDLANRFMRNPKLLETMYVYDDGIIKGVINGLNFGNHIELCDFYVEPFFKRQGIGRQLINYLIQEAKRQNMDFLLLWVISENTNARKFYEKNGFCATGETAMIEGTDKLDMCYKLMIYTDER